MNWSAKSARLVLLSATALLFAASLASAIEPPVSAVAFTPDGDVVVGSENGVQFRSWPDLKPLPATLKVDLARVHDLKFDPDGKRLAIAGGQPGANGGVEVWDWKKQQRQAVYEVSDDVVYVVDWSPDNRQLICGCSLNHLSVIDIAKGASSRVDGHSKSVFAVAALGEQGWLSAGADRSVRWWRRDIESSSSENPPLRRTLNNHTGEVVAMAVRPSEAKLAMVATAGLDHTVRMWQPTIGRLVRFARLPSLPLAIAWTPDGTGLAAACRNGRVYLIDPDTVEVTDAGQAVDSWAYCIAAAPDGTGFVVGGSRGQLHRVAWKR